MAVRIRRSVWSLPQGDTTLSWYRKAVADMLKRPQTDPSSWRYLAMIHGVPDGVSIPPGAKKFWDQCQHQSWFFLPWHRGYVAAFEAAVAKTVAGLGGPKEWALPYWNYSESLAKNPNARLMPPDFRNQKLSDGIENALWSKRAKVSNGDFGLDDDIVTLDALNFHNFANSSANASGFGGPVTGFSHGGGPNGGLESLPHNAVHVQIGGQNGFMSFPPLAALDPIFWLHHANIDRLWEVWRNQGALFKDPNTANWLSTVKFPMHDASNKAFSYVSADMLDTTKVLHGYKYDSVPVAHEPPEPKAPKLEAAMAQEVEPELAGASKGSVALKGDVTHATVSLRPKLTTRSFTEAAKATPQHVYLNLENITGTGNPGDYKVYLHMPNSEKALAGVLTTFGLERASDPKRSHGGSGIHHVFDITKLADRLGLTRGTASQLDVSFERKSPQPSEEGAPAGLEDLVRTTKRSAAIKVGRVSVYYD